jgi:hypothetical protein
MHPHKKIAQELNSTRLLVDQAMMMLNLIHEMGYLSVEEKVTLVEGILLRAAQDPIDQATLVSLFERCPIQDFTAFGEEWPKRKLIFALGDMAVAEWLPEILEKITGDPPALPDEEEIARVHQEMWKVDQPLESLEQPSKPIIGEEGSSSCQLGNWEVIFRSYDPVQGRHHYRMLRNDVAAEGRAFSSLTGGIGMQEG